MGLCKKILREVEGPLGRLPLGSGRVSELSIV